LLAGDDKLIHDYVKITWTTGTFFNT